MVARVQRQANKQGCAREGKERNSPQTDSCIHHQPRCHQKVGAGSGTGYDKGSKATSPPVSTKWETSYLPPQPSHWALGLPGCALPLCGGWQHWEDSGGRGLCYSSVTQLRDARGGGELNKAAANSAWANLTNILMEGDASHFMQPKHFNAIKWLVNQKQTTTDKTEQTGTELGGGF